MAKEIPRFGQLKVHRGKHPLEVHTFNPYANRDFTPNLDKDYFNMLLDAGGQYNGGLNIDHCFTGCLDAPEYIPLGGSERIKTIEGYEREEYMNCSREQTDWKSSRVAEIEMSKMIKELLEETA